MYKGCGPQRLGSPLKLKDACYNKVKARYDVFPSAYASGAIAKCRKVGAKNWGNKAQKKAKGGLVKKKYSNGQAYKYRTTRVY